MARKKNKLVVESFDKIKIIGINTAIMDYQLAWNLNKFLKISLVKYKDIYFDNKGSFSYYYYDAGENDNTFNLISLKSYEGKDWVSFKPKTDYLFLIRNFIKESDFQEMFSIIKSIAPIEYAYVVDSDRNSKMDIVIEDIEYHEMELAAEENKANRITKDARNQ